MITDFKTSIMDDLYMRGHSDEADETESKLLASIKKNNIFMGNVDRTVDYEKINEWVTHVFDNSREDEDDEDWNLTSIFWKLDTGNAHSWDDFIDEVATAYFENLNEAYKAYQDKNKSKGKESKPKDSKDSKDSKASKQTAPSAAKKAPAAQKSSESEKESSSCLSKLVKLACIVYLVYLAKKFVKVEWFKQAYDKFVKSLNSQAPEKEENNKKEKAKND